MITNDDGIFVFPHVLINNNYIIHYWVKYTNQLISKYDANKNRNKFYIAYRHFPTHT